MYYIVIFKYIYSPIDIDWNVLSQLVPIVENNNDVDLKLNFEFLVLNWSTRINLGEKHVSGDLQIFNAVSIRNLDVLHFGGLCFTLKCFDTYQLDLYRFYLQLWVSLNDEPIERFIEAAVRSCNDAVKFELGDGLGRTGFQVFMGNHKLFWD